MRPAADILARLEPHAALVERVAAAHHFEPLEMLDATKHRPVVAARQELWAELGLTLRRGAIADIFGLTNSNILKGMRAHEERVAIRWPRGAIKAALVEVTPALATVHRLPIAGWMIVARGERRDDCEKYAAICLPAVVRQKGGGERAACPADCTRYEPLRRVAW